MNGSKSEGCNVKQWTYFSALASIVLLSGCGEGQQAIAPAIPNVKVASQVDSTTPDTLYFPAVAHAAQRSQLSFRVAGEVINLHVREGDRILKGAVIAELDPTDYRLEVENAQARFSVVDSQFNRSKPLVEKGLLAKSQFDEIAAQREIALAELELAKLRLSFTQLKAPMDGIISRVNVEKFENVQVGQQVVNIHSLDAVEVLIQLPDQLYTNQPSQEKLSQIQASVRVPSGNEYVASVQEFTTEPDPTTGTFTVTLSMPMPKNEFILDGMAVEVTARGEQVGLDLNRGIRVPIEAVFNADGDSLNADNKFVWIVNADSTVSKRKVVVGKASKESVQIYQGLNKDDQVVVAGIARLRDGTAVKVVAQEAGNE
nr:efflux RND transporter periplasmic adaptor subunit [Vibrio navarrensis]